MSLKYENISGHTELGQGVGSICDKQRQTIVSEQGMAQRRISRLLRMIDLDKELIGTVGMWSEKSVPLNSRGQLTGILDGSTLIRGKYRDK